MLRIHAFTTRKDFDMKTAIVGYPRIGANRELKFASEQYFRGACTEAELQETAKTLRLANLTQQKESGLDWIPSNDFSFYDGMLDTAFLLRNGIGNSDLLRWIPTLQRQEAIRAIRAM